MNQYLRSCYAAKMLLAGNSFGINVVRNQIKSNWLEVDPITKVSQV